MQDGEDGKRLFLERIEDTFLQQILSTAWAMQYGGVNDRQPTLLWALGAQILFLNLI